MIQKRKQEQRYEVYGKHLKEKREYVHRLNTTSEVGMSKNSLFIDRLISGWNWWIKEESLREWRVNKSRGGGGGRGGDWNEPKRVQRRERDLKWVAADSSGNGQCWWLKWRKKYGGGRWRGKEMENLLLREW